MPSPSLSTTGRVFAVAAFLEALTWVGLLVAMFLKYQVQTPDNYVWLFGRLHGGMFLAYFVIAFVAGARLKWPGWALLVALLAAVPPLVTVPVEMWFRRRGLLAAASGGSEPH
ncbi:DUF3817 domain-containing protein [Arenimonas composti]|uniref:DUF3817 domain-containing protein n=1 Tax=Arenimonas composti TR7-09 = DSM 18010 TaxID=1121013 RepID=A0A091BIM3_9GAMM|nr:DUF3817 domain-containing protein [Arenimonas composti]KFN51367.1 hypothetical protein P873_03620 [Arenimonas composti TR7-09 = DSM 18010]